MWWGPGISGLDGHALAFALCRKKKIAERSTQFYEGKEDRKANAQPALCREALRRSSASQLQLRNDCAFVRERDSEAARRGSDDEQSVFCFFFERIEAKVYE